MLSGAHRRFHCSVASVCYFWATNLVPILFIHPHGDHVRCVVAYTSPLQLLKPCYRIICHLSCHRRSEPNSKCPKGSGPTARSSEVGPHHQLCGHVYDRILERRCYNLGRIPGLVRSTFSSIIGWLNVVTIRTHHRTVASILREEYGSVRVTLKILTIVVESGALFSIIWVKT
jgi:hypothetical protein